jgi:SpoVK/Ycf46/Vps4 family AAA+-type ATPase
MKLTEAIRTINKLQNAGVGATSGVYESGGLDDELGEVAQFLCVDKLSAWIISLLYCNKLMGESITLKSLYKALRIDPIDTIAVNEAIKSFVRKGLLTVRKNRSGTSQSDIYEPSEQLMAGITSQNKKLLEPAEVENINQAIIKIANFIDRLMLPPLELCNAILEMASNYCNFELIADLCNSKAVTPFYKVISIYCFGQYILHGRTIFSFQDIQINLFENPFDSYEFAEKLTQNHPIFSEGYFARPKSQLLEPDTIVISETVQTALSTISNKASSFSPKLTKLIEPTSIPERNLFFNDDQQVLANELTDLLAKSKFMEFESRMLSNNKIPGLNILFHGYSGTGKTELVYQIAKNTNRAILQVNLSKLRSMWIGESEKNIAAVFAEYRQCVDFYKDSSTITPTPILLFNECDGVLGNRMVTAISAVDHTFNTISSVLLNELEEMRGICICTTNLISSLDKAFDRRFLYKIKFELPNESTRLLIIRDRFPEFDSTIVDLINEAKLTGGQLENIRRRFDIAIIMKRDINEGLLRSYIEEEGFRNTGNKIGFSTK